MTTETLNAQKTHRLSLSKSYQAPVNLVWDVWTKPQHVAQWWGPFGPEQTKAEIDFVVGGTFYVGMLAPDGSNHPCRGTIVEIVKHEKFVLKGHPDALDPCGAGVPPNALVTISFEPQKEGKTKVTMTAEFESNHALEQAKSANWATNGALTLEQLGEYIADQRSKIL